MTHILLAPCGWTVERLNPRGYRTMQLYRPRGDACDGCTREGVTYYEERGEVRGPLCRVVAQVEETQETPRRTRRRTETAVGDEDRMGREQRTLF